MLSLYDSDRGRLTPSADAKAILRIYSTPSREEQQSLIQELAIDEHTLASALDPDEISRLEFEDNHVALILKRPRNQTIDGGGDLEFGVASVGVFLFPDAMVAVQAEGLPLFDFAKAMPRFKSVHGLLLRLIANTVAHFRDHLRAINQLANELEDQIIGSMENRHLFSMFGLEKSLVFYMNAIEYNEALLGRLSHHAAKIGFSPEEVEILDDLVIENKQCGRQARIYSGIVGGLMDARAGIVNNNLNQLLKTLNLLTISLMVPTMVVSVFSMNVDLPLRHDFPGAFWIILSMSAAALLGFLIWLRFKRW